MVRRLSMATRRELKQNFEDIETYGLERWLGELAQGLKSRT